MTVLYITHNTNPHGGATKALRSLIDGLRPYGVKAIVVTLNKDDIYQTWQKDGIEMIALNYREASLPDLNNPKDYALFIPRLLGRRVLAHKASSELARIIKERNIDIVHSNVSVLDIGYMAARKAHVPHVHHVREYGDLFLHYFPSRVAIDREIAKEYSICITKGIQDYHGLSGKATSHVIYDGVMPQKETRPKQGDGNYFLLAGRIEPIKGTDFMLRGYAEYAQKAKNPLPVWLAGDCFEQAFYEMLQQFISTHHIKHLVKFLGPRTDLSELMQNAKATIVSSTFEGFGLCMAEAMFNGCPVIGRDLTGTKEQFDNGYKATGEEIGFRYTTEHELAEHLLNFTNSADNNLQHILSNAFDTVNNLYTVEVHARQVFNLYTDILHNKI